MKIALILSLVITACTTSSFAFVIRPHAACVATRQSFVGTSLRDAPPATSVASTMAEVDIPSVLPSDVGMDYVPLATYLATGQLAEADQVRSGCLFGQLAHSTFRRHLPCRFHCFYFFLLLSLPKFTRDALIVLAGSKAKGRNFVYFTEVKNIPSTDLATIERLWQRFSGGRFGYSVQAVRRRVKERECCDVRFWPHPIGYTSVCSVNKNVPGNRFSRYQFFLTPSSSSQKKWRQSKGDFEVFCRKIGWTTKDGEVERKKRWFGASEFIYDVKKAPEGHLPLTSALRGTSLLKQLLNHPVWSNDDWKKEPEKN